MVLECVKEFLGLVGYPDGSHGWYTHVYINIQNKIFVPVFPWSHDSSKSGPGSKLTGVYAFGKKWCRYTLRLLTTVAPVHDHDGGLILNPRLIPLPDHGTLG